MTEHDSTIAAVRNWAAARRLPETCLDRWLKMEERDRTAVLLAVQTLRLTTASTATLIATLEEIAMRDGCGIESILARREIARIVCGHESVPSRAKEFLDAIRAIRFPRLAEATSRLKAEIAALGLPHSIAVTVPKNLASDEIRIEIRGRNASEVRRAIEVLGANADKLARITDLLGGSDEV